MNSRRLIGALLIGVLIYGVSFYLRHRTVGAPNFPVTTQGRFVRDGHYPGEQLALAQTPRTWGSWAGNDANEGTLRIGPFPAPARLRLALSGYPHSRGNDLFLEMADLNLRLPLPAAEIGERWQVEEYDIPFGWRGRRVTIVAVDTGRGEGGWLAVSEPLPLASGRVFEFTFLATLGAWICNGLFLGLCFVVVAHWLIGKRWIGTHWVPLVAGAAVALLGYAAFWVYFAQPLVGRWFSLFVLGAALLAWVWKPGRVMNHRDEWPAVLKLTVCVGLFHLALLYLFPEPRDFYDLAANRFVEALPGDNRIPHDLAMRLYHDQSPKKLGGDWLSSDRPPLETGWQLLTWPVTAALGFGETTASGAAAVWFQLLWVSAAYGLLRTLGLKSTRALAWIGVLSLSGFFVQNTVFTWPKLSAAALACGAFGLWVLPSASLTRERRRAGILIGAVLAALAWLSHGGIAFSFLVLGPWLIWRAVRGEWSGWLTAGGIFLLIVAPWTCYQQFYEPPGNRLLKWHLGGQIAPDTRGTWETIRDGYRALSGSEIVARKTANLKIQVTGDWWALADFSRSTASARRQDEFFHAGRALTWWLAAIPVLGWMLFFKRWRTRLAGRGRAQVALAAWIVATTVVWCLLMFIGGQAVIHQGSYAVVLAAFVLLSAWLETASRWWLIVIGGLQAATLLSTYAVSNTVIHGPAVGWVCAVAITAVVLGFIVSGAGSRSRDESAPDAS